jgi:hypothetical protein
MRALIYAVGVVAIILILLGVFLKALKWLIIIGLVALIGSIVLGVIKGRAAMRHHG